MTADEIAAAVKAGHADVVDLWEAVQQFAAQRSSKWLKLGRGGVTFDDLQQEAFIAMLQALEDWDPDAGAFLTWYGIWIKNAFTVACSLRSAKGQRSPLEMAVSLDAPVSENPDGETLVDFLPDTSPSVEELVEAADQRQRRHDALMCALDTLSDRQRAAVVGYYFFHQKTKRTLRQLGLNRLREKHRDELKNI